MLDNSEQIHKQLNMLTDAGFQLALDDFGTGYSSLSHLKTLDLNFIKIDQAFVRNLLNSGSDLALCIAIITIAGQMQLLVIAEGVETREQQVILKNMGASFLQGYLYSKPVPMAEFDSMLDNKMKFLKSA